MNFFLGPKPPVLPQALLLMCALSLTQNAIGEYLNILVTESELQESYSVQVEYPGLVKAAREVDLAFEISGRLNELIYDVGDKVRAGDVLARIDCVSYESSHKAAQARVQQAEANLLLAEADFTRIRKVHEAGFVSEQIDGQFNAQLKVAKANLRVAESAALIEQDRLADCELVAPWPGMIQERFFDEGQLVSGTVPIFHLVQNESLEVDTFLSSELLEKVTLGDVWEVVVGDRVLTGIVSRYAPAVSTRNRVRKVTLTLPPTIEDESGVKSLQDLPVPGQGVTVYQTLTRDALGFWVDASSLTIGGNGLWNLLTVRPKAALDNNDAKDIGEVYGGKVKVLHLERNRAYVQADIAKDMYLIARGGHLVVPGQTVELSFLAN